jgi:beta-lactamase regulating signal transducer with metallopeptidase domain
MPTILEIALSNAAVATVLALLAAGIAKVYRRPALTHCLWLLVLLKLVTPPLIPVRTSWTMPDHSKADTVGIDSGNDFGEITGNDGNQFSDESIDLATSPERQRRALDDRPSLELRVGGAEPDSLISKTFGVAFNRGPLTPVIPPQRQWDGLLAILIPFWLAGSVLVLAWTTWSSWRFHRLLKFARPAPSEAQKQVQELARRLGLKRWPILYLVNGAVSPMLWGVPPRLLFPARLLRRLDRDQRAALFVHELAHLKRRDNCVRILELIGLTLYWWHPAVWWARRELHEAEEQCCDAWVVWAQSGQSRAYALALLHTVDFFSHARPTLPLTASGIGQVPHLRRRLTMIMQARTPRSITWAGGAGVLALGLLLPLAPVLGQPAPEKPKDGQVNKDERDQQIEALKKAIKYLEEQKNAETRNAAIKALSNLQKDEEKQIEIHTAQMAVDQLARQVKVKQKELKDLQAKLEAAQQRLNKLTGKKQQNKPIELKPTEIQWQYNKIYQDLAPLEVQFKKFQPVEIELDPLQLQWEKVPVELQLLQQQPPAQEKKSDLERKVEKLLKEVEELKRELQKHKQAELRKN